jgi:HEPN domain-containing protein
MSEADAQRAEARAWLAAADEDVRAARACLAADPAVRTAAAYHCQQAAEKILKSMLVAAARPFRKVHDLEELGHAAAQSWPDLAAEIDQVRPLTYWSFAFRYPMPGHGLAEPPETPEILAALAKVGELLAAFEERLATTGGGDRAGP